MSYQQYLFDTKKNTLNLENLTIIDIEGNGQKIPEIVEIGCLKLGKNAQVKNVKTWLIKPKNLITTFAFKIHHISNQDVNNCPSFEDIEKEIINFIVDNPIVGHNIQVDYKILKRQLPMWEPKAIYDTLELSRKLIKNERSHSLENLIKELGLNNIVYEKSSKSSIHRVKYDIFATWALYVYLMKKKSFTACMLNINNKIKRI